MNRSPVYYKALKPKLKEEVWLVNLSEREIAELVDLCTHCGRDTSFCAGHYVNRIPSDDDYMCVECQLIPCDRCEDPNCDCDRCEEDKCTHCGRKLYVDCFPSDDDGYCLDCQLIPCDRCGDPTFDYEFLDGLYGAELVCTDCYNNGRKDL